MSCFSVRKYESMLSFTHVFKVLSVFGTCNKPICVSKFLLEVRHVTCLLPFIHCLDKSSEFEELSLLPCQHLLNQQGNNRGNPWLLLAPLGRLEGIHGPVQRHSAQEGIGLNISGLFQTLGI